MAECPVEFGYGERYAACFAVLIEQVKCCGEELRIKRQSLLRASAVPVV